MCHIWPHVVSEQPNCPFQAAFTLKVVVVRERMLSKEKEIHGEWLTEERMQKSGEFSAKGPELISVIQVHGRHGRAFSGKLL